MANVYTISVSSGLGLQAAMSAYKSPILLSVSSGLGLQPKATYVRHANIVVSVSAGLGLSGSLTLVRNTTHVLSVSSGLGLQAVPAEVAVRTYQVTPTAGLGLQPTVTLARSTTYALSVSSGLGIQPVISSLGANHVYQVSVSSGLGLQPAATASHSYVLSVAVGLGLQAVATNAATHSFSVSSGLGLQPTASSPRTITLSVSSGIGLSGSPVQHAGIYAFSITVSASFSASITLVKTGLQVSVGLGLQPTVTATLSPPNTIGVPGYSQTGGPSVKLLSGISGQYPLSFVETPSGIVLAANGVDPMIRWDSLSATADFAGVTAPTAAPAIAASGLGTITGVRYAFARFIDSSGNPSNLSPIGVPIQCGHDQSIDDIVLNASTGSVTITARSHGLTTGASLILSGIGGLPLSGQYQVGSVIDQDHFTLSGVYLGNGTWTGGGAIVLGSQTVTYSSIPQPTQSRVSQIQLLRNLEGATDVFFVDGTLAPGTASYVSSASDETLSQQTAIALRDPDGFPLGLRFSPPPSNRPFLASYLGRVFAAGDIVYYAGCVSVTTGKNTIQGIGTSWTANFSGRRIYVKGAARSYGVSSLNAATQVATIDSPYLDSSSSFGTYFIRSSPSERKMLNWSEPDNPEAWPPWNGLAIPEDNDEITGMFVKSTFLFITEKRHIWKFQFVDDPARTGHIFLAAERGSLNHRLTILADDLVYLMDESGIYSFDGGAIQPISQPIQNVFHDDGLAPTLQVDWSQDTTLWHASLDPIRTIIRWFVAMVGQEPLTNAICYNYRLDRWWIESYPVAISSSCTGTIAEAANVGIPSGYRRALVGAECRMILCLGEGALDLAYDGGTLRGYVTSATSTTLTDSSASFASYLGGAPVTIVMGTGAGQTRIISQNTGTQLTVVQAWTTIPDTTSQYQIGGVSWSWRSGWLDVEDQEEETARDFIVGFQPTTSASTFQVQFYYDHSTSPEVFPFPYNDIKDGVTVNSNSSSIIIDMTSSDVIPGWRVFRQGFHTERYAYSDRYVQIYMFGVANDQVVRIYQASIRGVDQEGL